MKQVFVVNGKGPRLEDILRSAPPLGIGGEVTFDLMPADKESPTDTFRTQGQIIAVHQDFNIKPILEKRVILILKTGRRKNANYLVLNYEYAVQSGYGVIYNELEFHDLKMSEIPGCVTL